MGRLFHEHFYRFVEKPRTSEQLEWISKNCTSYFICREVSKDGVAHYHAYIKTTLAEKGWMQQMNNFGLKGNADHGCKKGGWQYGKDGELYIAKGPSAPYEKSPPVIVLNNRFTDEQVAEFHEKFWENNKRKQEAFEESRPVKKKKQTSWSSCVIDEITAKFDGKTFDKIDIAKAVCDKFTDDSKPWKRRLMFEMFEAIVVKLEGASHEHRDFCAANMVQNLYDTRF